ncbi:hypothetical protein [Paludibaculum fermentans]|uniref:hypothetical protein n=1 Tax=Paludibaculum fermentans TaxID=1473598 RepID=UPI003EBB16B9
MKIVFSTVLLAAAGLAAPSQPQTKRGGGWDVSAKDLPSSPGGQQTVQAGWRRHSDPSGFSVDLPPQWQVEARPGAQIVVRAGDDRAFVLVHPFRLRARVPARQFIEQLPGYLPGLFPAAQVGRSRQLSRAPDEMLASIRFDQGRGQATVLCSVDGMAGMLYAVAAGQAGYAAQLPVLVAVLRSFRFTREAVPAGGLPALAFLRWEDPKEGAFSFQVPRGWSVNGGMHRLAPVDTRTGVEMASPDGRVIVTAGDQNIPPFTLPNRTLASTGFGEGSWYPSPFGVKMMVRRYIPAVQFAAEYAALRYGRQCQQLRIVDRREHPQIARQISQFFSQIGGGILEQELTMGAVSFLCVAQGREMAGYVFAGTQRAVASGIGMWSVPYLGSFLAAPEAIPWALEAFGTMARTIRFNEGWLARQRHLNARQATLVAESHAMVTQTLDDAYWRRQQMWDTTSRRTENNILGLTDVVDPATGETWKVESGHNYYWRKDYTDTGAGTRTYDRPDIDFSPLLEW